MVEISGEIMVDGVWQRLPIRTDETISISRGRSAQGTAAMPSQCTLKIDNLSGDYSRHNPRSPLYDKLGRNTRFRLRVGDLPDPPAAVLVDTFGRTETDGWGQADSGQDWVIYDPFGTSPPASAYSVAGGAGSIDLTLDGVSRYIRTTGLSIADLDATFTAATSQPAAHDSAEEGVFATLIGRVDPVAHSWWGVNIGFRADSGLPGGQGRRIAVNIIKTLDGVAGVLNAQLSVPGVVYEPGVPVRVRVQMAGPHLRVRVWAAGAPEPAAWHSQAHDPDPLPPGEIGFRGAATAAATPTPVAVSIGNLTVRPLPDDAGVVRFGGEVPAWPPRRSRGGDRWSPIAPAGILRRLESGHRPLKSTMRRHIPPLFPLAYWPMEEGVQGDVRVASAVPNAGPLTVSGMDFSQRDAGLAGSDPLPAVLPGAVISSPAVPSAAGTSWSVECMIRIAEDDFPTAGGHQILRFTTTGTAAVSWSVAATFFTTVRGLVVTITDADGVEITTLTATHEAAVAGGGPALIGPWVRLRVMAVQTGADTVCRMDWLDLAGNAWGAGATLASTTVGRPARIATTVGPGVRRMGIGHLTLWGNRFHTGYLHGAEASTTGMRGQTTYRFLERLAASEGLPLTITGPGLERMGPYPPGTALDIMRAAEVTEMGILAEDRTTLALTYRARETLYNQPVALTLDCAEGLISDWGEPTDDDKGVINRVIAARREGSEAVAELTEGPLSVQPPPAGAGQYETRVETIVDHDGQLPGQAGWRLHLGTWDELRFPRVALDLMQPRIAPHLDAILRIGIGDRIQLTNPPDEYGPGPLGLLVMGMNERLGAGIWTLDLVCEPAGPWTVGHIVPDTPGPGDPPGHLDTDGSQLAAPAGAADTDLLVATTAGRRWVETAGPWAAAEPGDLPVDLVVGGERITATDIEPGAWDLYDRTETDTWGTATSGLPWVGSGGDPSDRTVAGGAGRITLQTSPGDVRFEMLPVHLTDAEVLVAVTPDHVATGAVTAAAVILRQAGPDHYRAGAAFLPMAGAVVGAVWAGQTLLASSGAPLVYDAGTTTWIRARVDGQVTRLKVWEDGQYEPHGWLIEHTLAPGGPPAGAVGVAAFSLPENSNTDPAIDFTGFHVVTQRMTVTRAVNGITKPHGTGADVRLADPMIIPL